ncbi:MAG: hypothetical protein Q9218_005766 [Villophora microphyllina]
MATTIPTTPFTLLYRCGHVRVFEVREITAKLTDVSSLKPKDKANESDDSPCGEIDLGTFRLQDVLADSNPQDGTRKVRWAPQEDQPLEGPHSEDTEEIRVFLDQEEEARYYEELIDDLSDQELHSEQTEEKVDGWWDVVDCEDYWVSEGDKEGESSRDVDAEVMVEVLEIV